MSGPYYCWGHERTANYCYTCDKEIDEYIKHKETKMPNETKNYAKKFNPSAGAAFGADKFGEGAIKLDITAEGLDALMKNLQVGGAIVLKFNKITSKGNPHYFTEILPPYNKAAFKTNKASKEVSKSDLG